VDSDAKYLAKFCQLVAFGHTYHNIAVVFFHEFGQSFELTLRPADAKLLRSLIELRIEKLKYNSPIGGKEAIIRLQNLLKEFDLNLNKLPQ